MKTTISLLALFYIGLNSSYSQDSTYLARDISDGDQTISIEIRMLGSVVDATKSIISSNNEGVSTFNLSNAEFEVIDTVWEVEISESDFWYIPFQGNEPIPLAMGTYTLVCWCPFLAAEDLCPIKTEGQSKTCTNNGCNFCCDQKFTPKGSGGSVLRGGGILIRASEVNYH